MTTRREWTLAADVNHITCEGSVYEKFIDSTDTLVIQIFESIVNQMRQSPANVLQENSRSSNPHEYIAGIRDCPGGPLVVVVEWVDRGKDLKILNIIHPANVICQKKQ